MKIHPREGEALTRVDFHSNFIVRPDFRFCLARKSMITLTGLGPVKVIMRIRPLRGLINQNIAARRAALKSTWPEGPCAILGRSEGPAGSRMMPFGHHALNSLPSAARNKIQSRRGPRELQLTRSDLLWEAIVKHQSNLQPKRGPSRFHIVQ